MPDVEKELDRLYELPDSEFTGARNELAKELKGDGDAEGAERVRGLKKPSRAAAAINRAARASRKDVKRLLDAADALAAAQERLLQSGDRKGLNDAVKKERAAVDRLMARVEKELASGGGSASMSERARGTLHAVATDPELRDELEAGRLTEDRTAVGLGPLAAGGGKRPTRGASSTKKQGETRKKLKQAEHELEDAERLLRRARDEQSDAAGRLEAANAAVATAERERSQAEKARDKAKTAAEKA